MSYSIAQARDLAMNAFLHVVARDDLAAAFLAASGLRAEELRQIADSPELGLHVLDFILDEDARVLEAAEELGVRPQDLMAARVAMAGPGSFGWEVE